jgi:SAM-dependent methyltransferase
MNRLGRAVLNSPGRAMAQRRWVVPTMRRLGGGLEGCHALEIGCGGGSGSRLIIGLLHAELVDAIDIDPVMVRLAARRLDRPGRVAVGDMVCSGAAAGSYDAVVDMGAIHLEPRWREALSEVRRVLRPGGRLYFEEIVRPGRQLVSSVATGRRVPLDFALPALLGELDALGFDVVGLETQGWVSLTGLVGDVIGVATIPAGRS